MQIIKVKFLKDGQETGRPYTYFSNDVVAVGDIVQINESAKGVVVEIDVPEIEIESFKDKVKMIIGKVAETDESYRIVNIKDINTGFSRIDGRYPLRIGRICKKPIPFYPYIDYLKNADCGDYSGFTLHISTVQNHEEVGNKIIVTTQNSIYEFEKVEV